MTTSHFDPERIEPAQSSGLPLSTRSEGSLSALAPRQIRAVQIIEAEVAYLESLLRQAHEELSLAQWLREHEEAEG